MKYSIVYNQSSSDGWYRLISEVDGAKSLQSLTTSPILYVYGNYSIYVKVFYQYRVERLKKNKFFTLHSDMFNQIVANKTFFSITLRCVNNLM